MPTKKKRGRPRKIVEEAPVEIPRRRYPEDYNQSAWFSDDELASDEEWVYDDVGEENLSWEDFRASHTEIIDQLPFELQRTYRVIVQLETQSETMRTELNELVRQYITTRSDQKTNTSGLTPVLEQEEAGSTDDPERPTPPPPTPSHPPSPQPSTSRPPPLHPSLARTSYTIPTALKCTEDKFSLASGAYQRVDRHIQTLDAEMEVLQASILAAPKKGNAQRIRAGLRLARSHKRKGLSVEEVDVGESEDNEEGEDEEEEEEAESESEPPDEASTNTGRTRSRPFTIKLPKPKGKAARKNKAERDRVESEVAAMGLGVEQVNLGREAVSRGKLEGMEVNDLEPRYCYCKDVSYGKMVGCDNDDCAIEWFHLGCCNLDKAPVGKWYCNECQDPRLTKKKKK